MASEPAAATAPAPAPAPSALRDPFVNGRVEHPPGYRTRRFLNWFPLGFAYALLYMGRYNLTVASGALGNLMPPEVFGNVFGVGAMVYGLAFFFNGPLTDRIGGRKAMLLALGGAIVANVGMGAYVYSVLHLEDPKTAAVGPVMTALFTLNMYFQSFGAVSIVKVNAPWFHVRERGGFSGIFGIMISSGIFFAYDLNERLLDLLKPAEGGIMPTWYVFFVPAALLAVILVIEAVYLRDTPAETGHQDIETGAARSEDDDRPVSTTDVLKRILSNPIILTIAAIEFCTGALRDGTFQWFKKYTHAQVEALAAAHVPIAGTGTGFALKNQGLMQMIAGILGGNFAGWVSDKVFGSRRAPAAGLLYGLLLASMATAYLFIGNAWVLMGLVFLVAIGVIGSHGVLSGAATMDFGGRKGTATAVGVIDGCVYLGAALQSFVLGRILKGTHVAYTETGFEPGAWSRWPLFLLPFSVVGLVLLMRIWHAIPNRKGASH